MKNNIDLASSPLGAPSSSSRFQPRLFLIAAAMSLLLLSARSTSFAGSATWKTNPGSGDWNTTGNWTAGGPPNGPMDNATFQFSNRTNISTSATTEVDGIGFNPGASSFRITASPNTSLIISGVGITNNSGIMQSFVAGVAGSGGISFRNSATAGSLTAFTNNGGMLFFDTSTAGNGTFTNNGSTVSGGFGGFTGFFDTSTAGNATFTNNGDAVSGAHGSGTIFSGTSTAGNGNFTSNGGTVSGASGGQTSFGETATADNGTFTANGGLSGGAGGSIQFVDVSTGGTARVEVFGNGLGGSTNGNLDISSHNAPGVTIGSIEGSGVVFLGANNLTVGSNNLNATFSGIIQDGGLNGGTGGSLTKIGEGKLVFTGANTYTGGTVINGGKLLVNNTSGSGTGSGPVQVNDDRLGGTGTIAGAVTIGTANGPRAILSPGRSATSPNTLTINSTLTFDAHATYKCTLDRTTPKATKVVANGVTINSGAQFFFADLGAGTLTAGTVFTVINNTAATPIAGTFSNLPDGSSFTSNGTTFQVNYEGGTGNDLTLTVVP